MKAFVFKPSNEFIGKFDVSAHDEVHTKLQAFLILQKNVPDYSYVESNGRFWTIVKSDPLDFQEGRIQRAAQPPQEARVPKTSEIHDLASEAFLEVTLERTLSIWWSYAWRFLVFSAVAGLLLGACGGFIVGSVGRPDLGAPVGALLGWMGSVIMSFVVFRIVLCKTFSSFSIKLVKR
jgi:hypothetical protein